MCLTRAPLLPWKAPVILEHARDWSAVCGLAMVYVGTLVTRVHGLPRRLRRSVVWTNAHEGSVRGLHWLDQYSWIGLGLISLGLLSGLSGLLVP